MNKLKGEQYRTVREWLFKFNFNLANITE